ncbi:MAG: hypothetical protein H0V66_00040, partial [Bdellovibrionales bacterium]|nr:hypothetical protein [Bdellovibrionales bacterium]
DIINRLFIAPEKFLGSEPKEKPKKIKTESQTQVVPESTIANINFRDRIMSLKTDVNAAVAKANSSGKDKVVAESSDNSQTNKKPAAAKAENAEGELALNNGPLALPPPKKSLPIDIGHSVRVGYYTVDTNSEDNLLNTDSHPKYLLMDYEYARGWSNTSKLYHHINVRYGKALNKEEKEFAPYTGGSLMEGYFVESLKWMPKTGIEIDTISFKNLPRIGKGLKVANNRIFWMNLASANNFELFSQTFRLTLTYSRPFKIISGYNGLDENPDLSGSKMNLTFAALDLYKKFHLEINYFKSTLEAKAIRTIVFDTQGVGLNAYYNF